MNHTMKLKELVESIQAHVNGKIPVVVAHKFSEIGEEQKKFMPTIEDMCKLLGDQGICCGLLKNVGSLLCTMTCNMIEQDFSYDKFKQQVLFIQRTLDDPDQCAKDLEDHIAHNFEKGTISYDEYKERIDSFFSEYAKTHRSLSVYNMIQRWCKELGESIGKQDFQHAKSIVDMIVQNVTDPSKYQQAVTSHHLDSNGQLTEI